VMVGMWAHLETQPATHRRSLGRLANKTPSICWLLLRFSIGVWTLP
jgi:hypothetical protein